MKLREEELRAQKYLESCAGSVQNLIDSCVSVLVTAFKVIRDEGNFTILLDKNVVVAKFSLNGVYCAYLLFYLSQFWDANIWLESRC